MAATLGISQFFFAYNRLIISTAVGGLVGRLSLLIQRCVILILVTRSKKVLQLCKERFCTTETLS